MPKKKERNSTPAHEGQSHEQTFQNLRDVRMALAKARKEIEEAEATPKQS